MQVRHNDGITRINPSGHCKSVHASAGHKPNPLTDQERARYAKKREYDYTPTTADKPRRVMPDDGAPMPPPKRRPRDYSGFIDCLILLAVAFMAGITLRELTDVQAVYWLVGGMGLSVAGLFIIIIAKSISKEG